MSSTTIVTPRQRQWGFGRPRARALALVALVLMITPLVVATRLGGRSAEPARAAPPSGPISGWLDRLELADWEKQLVRAGYSVRADGSLDPVTKSAFADYLRLDASHPLGRFLATKLEGTVLTGFRDPAAWNKGFGLNRRTRFVERPLTGPNGQLDANGNLR